MTEEESPYVIRPPAVEDVEALGTLHCRVWQEAYVGLMDEAAFAELTPERFARGWGRRLVAEDGLPAEKQDENLLVDGRSARGERVVVAQYDDGLVGFISVGPAREEDGPTDTQLWAINVLAEHYGTGVAQELMDIGLGEGPAYLWVAEGNDRAIRFYERNHFRLDGGRATDREDGLVELRMVRR
ncbi:GNAT family N-acetyltransferase [Ornithinimicrobium sp. F0845]|uniref:GNAT family N-acetyltransferase n=1 Tax=Ornithinimicrobium sp. F0845 TaxID=2926412 RepID=UPI001FF2BFB0|nr:GNAT family N-acetyltransferase [Ornithinimicrobium sp. F0845]MCK0112354.1 GNAT family N-acetyltransferase [Ornithinimicrobium sp. F0845]